MIRFSHVTKTYEDDWRALSDITCRIYKGEFVFLTGHSGAGKSTFLKMIYMDDRPDTQRGGQITVKFSPTAFYDSKTTKDASIQTLRRYLGVVFQDFKLLSDRNVYENVALALRMVGVRNKEIKLKVFDALALVGITAKRLAMPYTLSGGEQQRVAIARAIVHNPYLLLADEPTGNLDPDNANEVFSIFKEINARGTTVVMATHNPDFYLDSPFRRLSLTQGKLLNRDIF
ncbi:MAG: ATP-binding cassette domain-containing protein [Fibrobacter sp.]|jgi:cell division transport system ATP-binding protein|nr:ATP-binding cassette domain-containing protein [Fibrobacter sp.]